jgi:type I restriction enzyme R subunit
MFSFYSPILPFVFNLPESRQCDFTIRCKKCGENIPAPVGTMPDSWIAAKLPAPKEEDLSKGLIETIDMDSYRVEKQHSITIALPDDADAETEPVPTAGGGHRPEPELDTLSNIIKAFNEQFGNIDWKDADKIRQVIVEEIPAKVSADKAYRNAMKSSDRQNARIEHDKALQRVIVELLADHAELFKQFSDNPSFKKWLGDTNLLATFTTSISDSPRP